ncbi:MAG: hypothetical protein AAB579_02020 [Patescibacteria group bacterium]
MTTKQLTHTKQQTLTAPSDALLVWQAARGIWKKNRTSPLKYQRVVRTERDL